MSSLIEQAARRLEELRRAGVDVSGEGRESMPRDRADPAHPTPEAAVLAMQNRAASYAREKVSPVSQTESARINGADTPLRSPSRRVEIGLPRLKMRGFVTPDTPASVIAEEFRVIKRPIIRNALGATRVPNGNLVMVTSALPGEGKTFTAVNLALSIASEVDSRVLLVDGDVAHPSLPELLNVPQGPGLLDLLTEGSLDFADALVRTEVDKLTVLPAGTRHRRSTELLASEQMASLLREMASRYSDRIVIFDSPPLLATSEARALASSVGQIIMVVAADATSQHAVDQALATIEACEIVLMVLNKASRTDVGAYYGYYATAEAR